MGKQGPCYHCGVSSTPLWRNGPPEKPVLCNACGSRWRTKGTLANYTPLHLRAETDEPGDNKISLKNKEMKFTKRKLNDNHIRGRIPSEYNIVSQTSSGSVISNSDSCGQFGYEDASDLADPSQSIVWETMVPSKKRTSFARPEASSIEKLTRDLYTIYKEQQKSSQFSSSYEDDLIFDSSMISVDIRHGSMLIQCPKSIVKEDESDTSSLSFENKLPNEAHSMSPPFSMYSLKVAQTEKLKRDKAQHDIMIMGNHNPQLLGVDISDVINFDVFTHFLSHEEQQQLLKYLPALDTPSFPHRLESMFTSIEFKENMSSFQKWLAEGILNHPPPSKKLPLLNVSNTKWLEKSESILKDVKCKVKKEQEEITCINPTSTNRKCSSKSSGLTTPPYKSPDRMITNGKDDQSFDKHFEPKNISSLPTEDEDLLLEVPSNNSFPQAELFIFPTSTLCSKTSKV